MKKLLVAIGIPIRFAIALCISVILTIVVLVMPRDNEVYDDFKATWSWVMKG